MSIRNIDAIFYPKSVVLIGASRKALSVGDVLAGNLLGGGFEGPVMFVHPHAPSIHASLTYPTVEALPITPDLAVIATPPDTVSDLIARLGAVGTRAAVVISAGFGEIGADGLALQNQILEMARPHCLRVVGPNCVGVLSPLIGLNASFAHLNPSPGKIALLTQSGAMLTAILDWAHGQSVGFSHLVSLGGMADVDIGDMLDYLAGDPKAEAILIYAESITHARKFMSAARRAARVKPVVIIKAGRHAEGAKAAASHTGALAGADDVYDAAFRRAGLLRVATIEELFDAAGTLAHTQRIKGDRVAVLTNGGGLGVLSVDRMIDLGIKLAELSPQTMDALNAKLPRTWSHGNPVDIIGDAPGERYRNAMDALIQDPNVDTILVLNCPVATANSFDAAKAVTNAVEAMRAKGNTGPSVSASWLGRSSAREVGAEFSRVGIPHFSVPENAVQAMSHMLNFQRNQSLLMQTPEAKQVGPHDAATARAIIAGVLREGREWLTEIEAKSVLKAYGIPIVETMVAKDSDDAIKVAESVGFPVALKILSPDITHKTDVGGVALNLVDAATVKAAADGMLTRISKSHPNARLSGFSVQKMAHRPGAHELICGIIDDAVFGPAILFGHGGTAVDVMRDRAIALPPLNAHLIADMVGRTRIARLLAGYRGRPAVNMDAVTRVLIALEDIAADCPEVSELDINPLWADQSGVLALDARIRVVASRSTGTQRFSIRPYPSELEADLVDRVGRRYSIRPIRPDDAGLLHAMVADSDPEDIRMRFFTALRSLPDTLVKRLTQIDYDREMAFVAFEFESWKAAGIVRLACDPDFNRAEFAIIVRHELKGQGLGSALLDAILKYARTRGVSVVFGDVLADNKSMLGLAHSRGFKQKLLAGEPGVVEVSLAL